MRKLILTIISIIFISQSLLSQMAMNEESKSSKTDLFILFGLHAFIPNYNDPFLPKVCFQEMIGGELVFNKINLSLDIRRNYWISIYGGSYNNILDGLSRYDNIGIKKNFNIRDNTFKIGIGHTWIMDMKYTQYYADTISNEIRFYPFRAISPYVVYSVKQFDIELRAYFLYNKNTYTEAYNKFDKSQINLGIVYRWCPKGWRN
jgi:hypothetical protein